MSWLISLNFWSVFCFLGWGHYRTEIRGTLWSHAKRAGQLSCTALYSTSAVLY